MPVLVAGEGLRWDRGEGRVTGSAGVLSASQGLSESVLLALGSRVVG